ncbi:unnamed protein product [Rotaria sp. Silwood2]|nr:unnamed protein product [Rotaria sp. Silwood2]CAF4355390.1 unnamed protein product [Rotaria sp. Silwood2]
MTLVSVYVIGVKRTWERLKLEFDRHTDELSSQTARYYQTLYAGPKLFGVDENDVLYYHDKEQWIPYDSVRNVTYSYDPDFFDDNECDDVHPSSLNLNYEQTINERRVNLLCLIIRIGVEF